MPPNTITATENRATEFQTEDKAGLILQTFEPTSTRNITFDFKVKFIKGL